MKCCSHCNANLHDNHILEDTAVAPMSNRSRILQPKCAICNTPISISDVDKISRALHVILISGTAGAGKTALGQMIEAKSDFIFIDGDAISKRMNHYARIDSEYAAKVVGHFYEHETIVTMMILLGLGYNVVFGFVISPGNLSLYTDALEHYGITPIFRVLVPNREVCLKRDADRECWTAGAEYVDKWYDEQRTYLLTHPQICIDTSEETLEETYKKHFESLIKRGARHE